MRPKLLTTALLAMAATAAIGQNTIKVNPEDSRETILEKAASVTPSARQLAAMDREYIAFVHFGPNTFTRKEWGDGMEDPKVFDLKDLDTDQWCRTMAEGGMKMVILTAKHHDGFVLWQSRYTDHGIMSSPFQDGKGDIMKELAKSCKKHGLKLGVYLSPADLYQIESPDGLYGNGSKPSTRTIPRPVEGRPFECKKTFRFEVDDYNEYYLNQLYELLTEYGPISEVWLDGAHPKRKGGQTYDYSAWRTLIRELAPEATVFGREDIRWCGNEAGDTRDAEWNCIPYAEDPATMTNFKDMLGDLGTEEKLFEFEKPYYVHYQPCEIDTSIRDGWFYRNDDEQRVRTAEEIFDIYERSVGGNAILLLNIPPNREGRFSERDSISLTAAGRMIRGTYGTDLLVNSDRAWQLGDDRVCTFIPMEDNVVEVKLQQPTVIDRIAAGEPVAEQGERIGRCHVEVLADGKWTAVAKAENIGRKHIFRFDPVKAEAIRLCVDGSRRPPLLSSLSAHLHLQCQH